MGVYMSFHTTPIFLLLFHLQVGGICFGGFKEKTVRSYQFLPPFPSQPNTSITHIIFFTPTKQSLRIISYLKQIIDPFIVKLNVTIFNAHEHSPTQWGILTTHDAEIKYMGKQVDTVKDHGLKKHEGSDYLICLVVGRS